MVTLDEAKNGLNEFTGNITRPVTDNIPLPRLLMFIALFLIIAWICWDQLRILGSWAKQAAEDTASTAAAAV